MDEREFVHEISASWNFLKEHLRLGRFFIGPGPLQIDELFQQTALDEESTYQDIFLAGLHRSNYNILLEDYAYFQFGRTDANAWRLGYFPNPWLSGVPAAEEKLRQFETLEEIGALSYEEASDLIADMPYAGAVPPIRFEFAPSEYQEFAHPAAHFHIGRHSNNRWPSAISLGPKAFVLIIAKMYYPDAWARCSTFHGARVSDCIELILLSVIANARAVHDFSQMEQRSFHFGKNMVARGA
jgi:hypothetical protein